MKINDYEVENLIKSSESYTKIALSKLNSMNHKKKNDLFLNMAKELNKALDLLLNRADLNQSKFINDLMNFQDELELEFDFFEKNIESKYSKIISSSILNVFDLQDANEILVNENEKIKNDNKIKENAINELNKKILELKDKSEKQDEVYNLQKAYFLEKIELIQIELENIYEKKLTKEKKYKAHIEKTFQEILYMQEDFEKKFEDYKTEKNLSFITMNQNIVENLYNIQNEAEFFYLKSKEKSKNNIINKRIGAVDIVQNSFTYKIGSLFVNTFKRKTYHKFPFSLSKLYLDFLRDNIQKDLDQLKNLDDYLDISEAEHFRNHLSYLIGKTILSNNENLINLPKLLFKEVKEFRIMSEKKVD